MLWQEEVDEQQFVVSDKVVDLVFKIKCSTLPVDHAWALSDAIQAHLPWFENEAFTGLHLIFGADSGNGWERPNGDEDLLYLSRRTRLSVRVPKQRVKDAATLSGKTLTISGHTLEIGENKIRSLAISTTLYSRHVVTDSELSEDAFLAVAAKSLADLNIRFKKILCGKSHDFSTPEGDLPTQSLMVAGLTLEDAVTLQQHGLGSHRNRGFGLFIPHKTV